MTFNEGFEERNTVPGDEVMASAVIDRVLHNFHLVSIRGNSCRTREHMAPRHALNECLGSRQAVRLL